MADESSAVMTEEKESSMMTMEDYFHLDQEAFKTPSHGDIVDGIVVRVDADEVLVYDEKRHCWLVAAVEIVSPANKDRPEH